MHTKIKFEWNSEYNTYNKLFETINNNQNLVRTSKLCLAYKLFQNDSKRYMKV